MEVDLANAGKVEIPIRVSAPLMNGSFILELDRLFESDSLEEEYITYENGEAYFIYDTIIDFYDELEEFLEMEELDFSHTTLFEQGFDLDFKIPGVVFQYTEDLVFDTPGGPLAVNVDTTVIINPQDTFKTRYDSNSIFANPSDTAGYSLEVLQYGNPIDLGIDFDIYRVGMSSGILKLELKHSPLGLINDDVMTLSPSFDYQYSSDNPPYSIDTTFNLSYTIPIHKDVTHLPEGVYVKTIVSIASLKSIMTDEVLDEVYIFSTLDSTIEINLSDYYYFSEGDGLMDLDVSSSIEIRNPEDTAIVQMPDTLYFDASIEDLVFNHAVFNYGIDTVSTESEIFDIDVFDDLPDDLTIEGFRLFNPELVLTLESNLGFSALLDVSSLRFTTDGAPEYITDDGKADIYVTIPLDPMDPEIYIPAVKDSILLDSTSSRLEEIELININGLALDYMVVVNPEDEAGIDGKHNFFYDYADDIQEEMYELKLNAEVRIPFKFKFEKISFTEIVENDLSTDSLDSSIYFQEDDSILLEVKFWTKDFPFDATAQIYLDELNNNGDLNHIDSLFNQPQLLLPSSNEGVFDSVMWEVVIDDEMYDHISIADSLMIDVSFSMDEDEYFQLKEDATIEIGYKFNLGKSSFVVKSDDSEE